MQKLSLNYHKLNKVKIKYDKNQYFTLKYFDIKQLHKESDLFFDWYLSKFLGIKKSLKDKKIIKKELDKIYKKIVFKNIVIVHRDFHVSNIMLKKKS